MLKKIRTLAIGTLVSIQGLSQPIDYKPIEIGQSMPDIPLGVVLNSDGVYNSAFRNLRFSNLLGKVVILDFWTTNCSSCIDKFPKMSELQEKFTDKIQIFLVNSFQDEKSIKEWMAISKKKRMGKSIIPANLPIIANAKILGKYFPLRGEIGYHVWIDKAGNIVLRGISANTHEKKIQQLLSGERIGFLQDNSQAYDAQKAPFFTKKNDIFHSTLKYSSSFGSFIADHTLVSPYGNTTHGATDSIAGTIRVSLINSAILDCYNTALRTKLSQSKILNGPKTLIETSDTSLIQIKNTQYNLPKKPKTDEEYRDKYFCYEQITPIEISELVRQQMMLEDLNRYFAYELGIQGNMEKREVSGLLLIVTNPEKLIKSRYKAPIEKWRIIDGMEVKEDFGVNLSDYLSRYISQYTYSKESHNNTIINDIQNTYRVDLTLPPAQTVKNVEELKEHLNKYGLDLVPGKKVVEMLVFRDAN